MLIVSRTKYIKTVAMNGLIFSIYLDTFVFGALSSNICVIFIYIFKLFIAHPVGNYMFKVDNRNTRTSCEICSKLTLKTPKRLYCKLWTYFIPCSSISIDNFEQVNAGWSGIQFIIYNHGKIKGTKWRNQAKMKSCFWKGDWALDSASNKFWDFPDIS